MGIFTKDELQKKVDEDKIKQSGKDNDAMVCGFFTSWLYPDWMKEKHCDEPKQEKKYINSFGQEFKKPKN